MQNLKAFRKPSFWEKLVEAYRNCLSQPPHSCASSSSVSLHQCVLRVICRHWYGTCGQAANSTGLAPELVGLAQTSTDLELLAESCPEVNCLPNLPPFLISRDLAIL